MKNILTSNNFLIYAAQNYNNPTCTSTEEFNEDLRRLKYIKKLCTKYVESGDLKERLILNHIIILHNVFDPVTLCRILYLKMSEYFHIIKPFLLMLGILQNRIYNVKKEGIVDLDSLAMDPVVVGVLRKL